MFFFNTEYSWRRLDFIGCRHTELNVLSDRCSSGHAVQCLAEFETSGALQWLGVTGPTSLLERTGLAQPGSSFRSSRIVNVTLGGKPERRRVQSETISNLVSHGGSITLNEWHLKQTFFTDPVTGRVAWMLYNSLKVTHLKSHSCHEKSDQPFSRIMNPLLRNAGIPFPQHIFLRCTDMLCCVKTLPSQSIQMNKWYDSAAVEDSVFMWFDVHPK